jgi:serine/threonine protein kinase
MAPELIKRQTTDQRLDIFSYAVTCFEMYTKRFPWDAALTIDAVMQHINKPPVHLTELIPNIDQQIAAAIMKGLAADPDRRWQNVSDMVAEIREAEARMVKAARKAAAAKDPAKAALAQSAPDSASTVAKTSSMPQAAEASAAEKVAAEKRVAARKKSGEKKQKKSSDDDIDLNEMFGD